MCWSGLWCSSGGAGKCFICWCCLKAGEKSRVNTLVVFCGVQSVDIMIMTLTQNHHQQQPTPTYWSLEYDIRPLYKATYIIYDNIMLTDSK